MAILKVLLTGLILAVTAYSSVLSAQPSSARTYARIATGVVVPEREVVVSAKIVGRIEAINHDEGVVVSAGDVLIRLEGAQWRAELQSAQASVALAKAELRHQVTHRSRVADLRERRSVSQDALDSATLAVAVAEAKLKIAQASVTKVEATLRETEIIAPFDALIVSKQTEIGEVTSPGAPLLRLQSRGVLKLRTRIKEKDIPYLRVGQVVPVTIDALEDRELQGTVSLLIPAGDTKTHTFVVEIDLPPQPGLYTGMFGQVSF